MQHEPPTFYCYNGKVVLFVPQILEDFYILYSSQSEETIEFQWHIRAYNSIFSFTSFGVKLDEELASSRNEVCTFQAQCQIYHQLPTL